MEKPKTSHTTPPSIRLIAPHRTSPEDPMCYFSPCSPLNFPPVQTYSRYLNNVNEPTMKPDRTCSPSCLEARLSELRVYGVLGSWPRISLDVIICGAERLVGESGSRRRRAYASSTPQRHGAVLRGGRRGVALPGDARRPGRRSLRPAPLA